MSTAEGGIIRLKMLQKSPGVMIGKLVGPKAVFGDLGWLVMPIEMDGETYLAETGTMRDVEM